MSGDVTVRQARAADAEAIAAFTQDTWDEFDRGDYIPDVFPKWVASDGPDQHTVVAEVSESGPANDGAVVGCCQVVLLSDDEAWTQGIRVHPDHRGTGVGRALDDACRDWARDRGARVVRHMVFSWNEQGLAASRSFGYRPVTAFRWADLDPSTDDAVGSVSADPDAGWSVWERSDARAALAGLALDPDESWALSTWTRDRLRRAADETAAFVVEHDRAAAVAWRTRVAETADGRRAEYGGAAWASLDAARTLFDALRRDAAAVDADVARVLVPERSRHLADAAAAGATLSDHADLVLAADVEAGD